MDDFRKSFKRALKERERELDRRKTPLERAELNRNEDVALVILTANAAIFAIYVYFNPGSETLLWAAAICSILVLAILILRFQRPLH